MCDMHETVKVLSCAYRVADDHRTARGDTSTSATTISSAYDMTNYLIGRGHKRSRSQGSPITRCQCAFAGFRKAMRTPSAVARNCACRALEIQLRPHGREELAVVKPLPSRSCCATTRWRAGAAALSHGLRIPEDFSRQVRRCAARPDGVAELTTVRQKWN